MSQQFLSPNRPSSTKSTSPPSPTPSPTPSLQLSLPLRRKGSRTEVACQKCRRSKVKCPRPNPTSLDPCGRCIEAAKKAGEAPQCRYLTVAEEEEENLRLQETERFNSMGEISPGLTDGSSSTPSSALPTTPPAEQAPWASRYGSGGIWPDASSTSLHSPQPMGWAPGPMSRQGSLQPQPNSAHEPVPFQWGTGNPQASSSVQGAWDPARYGLSRFPSNLTVPIHQNLQDNVDMTGSGSCVFSPSSPTVQVPMDGTLNGGNYYQNYVGPSSIVTPTPNSVLAHQTNPYSNGWPQLYTSHPEANFGYSEEDYTNEQVWQ